MNRLIALLPVVGLFVAIAAASRAAEADPEQADAIAEIQKLDGKVIIDEKSLGQPVVSVDLANTDVTDAGLKPLIGLTKLQSLNLRQTQVTDAGLGQTFTAAADITAVFERFRKEYDWNVIAPDGGHGTDNVMHQPSQCHSQSRRQGLEIAANTRSNRPIHYGHIFSIIPRRKPIHGQNRHITQTPYQD